MSILNAPLTNQKIAPSIGANLVINGEFQGNADGWTLGAGWSYSGNALVWTLLGPEMVTNGNFNGNANNWTLQTNGASLSWVYGSNAINVSGSPTSPGIPARATQSGLVPTLTIGLTYRLSYQVSNWSGSFILTCNLAAFNPLQATGNGTFQADLTLNNLSTGSTVAFTESGYILGSPIAATVDNVSVKQNYTGTIATQTLDIVSGQTYPVTITVTGTTGSVTAKLGSSGATMTIPAGTTVTANLLAGGTDIEIGASDNFNGTITGVSVGHLLMTAPKHATPIHNQ